MDPPSITTYIVLHHNSGQKTCIQVLYMGPEATLKQSVSCPADGQKCGQSSVCKISEYFIFFKFGGGGGLRKEIPVGSNVFTRPLHRKQPFFKAGLAQLATASECLEAVPHPNTVRCKAKV